MNIFTKLTLRFSIIATSILVVFSLSVYLFSANYRREEFYQRLESRGLTTAKLLVTVDEVSIDLLRIIDQNSVQILPEEQVLVFDKNNELAYSSPDTIHRSYSPELLDRIRAEKKWRFETEGYEEIGVIYSEGGEPFVIIASAYDRYGKSKLRNLRTVLLLGLPIGIGIIVVAGRIFAKQMLAPLADMNDRVSRISEGSLDQRLDEGNRSDEIARLAMNFNLMLERLERAFDVQKSFVSNASHELRTPLAAMRSQLQVTLGKNRQAEEYHAVLQSLLDDTIALSELTNGLLLLAHTGIHGQRLHFTPLRVDEVLFNTQEELARLKPDYRFQFDYGDLPNNEADLTLPGNERLLSVAFLNLMDNACKFSNDKMVQVSILTENGNLQIAFKDNGAGITPGDLEKIFTPFFRAENIQGIARGHGIGLPLSKKIVEMHGGRISVQSTLQKGSLFKIILPLYQV